MTSAVMHSVSANGRVIGLPATDEIGIISIDLFWAMLELGVGMIAICLPSLRPILSALTLKSLVGLLRSATNLRPSAAASKYGDGSTGTSKSQRNQDDFHFKVCALLPTIPFNQL